MWNAWKIIWASIGRFFTVMDVVTASAETAAMELQGEVDEWAEINQLTRRNRVNAARKSRNLPDKIYKDEKKLVKS